MRLSWTGIQCLSATFADSSGTGITDTVCLPSSMDRLVATLSGSYQLGSCPANSDTRVPTMQILIADDSNVFRAALRRTLEAEREFQIVAEAADGEEAV